MKASDTVKIAAATMALGIAAGAVGEMAIMKSGHMKTMRKKANKAMKAVETIVDDVKNIIG